MVVRSVQFTICAVVALLAATACSSSIVSPDGYGGGGTGTGGGASSVGAGGAGGSGGSGGDTSMLPCTHLEPAGNPVVLAKGGNTTRLAYSHEGNVYIYFQDNPGGEGFSIAPWTQWPASASQLHTFDRGYGNFFVVPSIHAGVTIGAYWVNSNRPNLVTRIFLDLEPTEAAVPAPLSDEEMYGFWRTGDGYAYGTSDAQDLVLHAIDDAAAPLWSRSGLGCAIGTNTVSPTESGTLLVGASVGARGPACIGGYSHLQVFALDSNGDGDGVLVPDLSSGDVVVTRFLPREGGARLVYWRATTSLPGVPTLPGVPHDVDYGVWWTVGVKDQGVLLDAPRQLDMGAAVGKGAEVAPVRDGFVGAGRARGEAAVTDEVKLDLYDTDGDLLQSIATGETAPAYDLGVRVLESPNGRSVLVSWVKEREDLKVGGEARLLRFDCVEP